MIKIVYLAVGGLLGTLSRHFLGGFVFKHFGSHFPYGTFLVNLAGCFLLGFLATASARKFLFAPEIQLLLMVGFCGAFTTFSTFILESYNLIVEGHTLRAFGYVLGSIAVGLLVFRLAIFLGDHLFS